MRLFHLIGMLLLAGVLGGCSSECVPVDMNPPLPSEAVADFLAEEPFAPLQSSRQIMDRYDAEFFVCEYGNALDCIGDGCLYSTAYGLSYDDRVGWLGFYDHHGYSPDSTRFYNFVETDTFLFDADTWFVLIWKDWRAYFDMLLPALAADEDTSRNALLTMSTLIYTHESVEIAENLVENPLIADDAEILGILAALPVIRLDLYATVRARAQELLDALG